jgi:16S rRNA (guanine966-N2)-methyltransferase
MLGELKIIGGRFKGKKIKVVDALNLRPTPNRIREAVFSSLQHDINNACCLDAFAGSGALGLEALSRGAQEVTFLESNKQVFQQLQKNLTLFGQEKIYAYCQNTLEFLQTTTKTYDLIFIDPPFQANLWNECCQWIEQRHLLNPHGLIYLESPHLLQLPPTTWQKLKSDRVAEVYYAIYLKN